MRKKIHLSILIFLLALGIILDLAPIKTPAGVDKIYHFIGFFVITVSSIMTYIAFLGKENLNRFFVFILTFGGLFAALSETIQNLSAVRDCDPVDWFVNISGIGVACLLVYLFISKKEKEDEY